MTFLPEQIARREFLRKSTMGLGALALGDLLCRDTAQLLCRDTAQLLCRDGAQEKDYLLPKQRAKRVIWLFMAGAPSQFELFEPKEALQRYHGQTLPPSISEGKRFAFIDGAEATLLGTGYKISSRGMDNLEKTIKKSITINIHK